MILGKKQKIKVRIFIELMGWPKETLNDTLKKIVDTIKKKWTVYKEDYSEPEKMGEKMFSSYVEFEAEFSDLKELFTVVLNYGPTVVEIIEPTEVYISGSDMQDIMADISSKINMLDRNIKILSARIKQTQGSIQKSENNTTNQKEAQNEEKDKTSKFTIKK